MSTPKCGCICHKGVLSRIDYCDCLSKKASFCYALRGLVNVVNATLPTHPNLCKGGCGNETADVSGTCPWCQDKKV
jgi:hypothetical protein